MTQLSNLLPGMTESSIHGNSDADEAIAKLTEDLCDICISDIRLCPVYHEVDRCPKNVTEKANYEYYHGDD